MASLVGVAPHSLLLALKFSENRLVGVAEKHDITELRLTFRISDGDMRKKGK